MRSRRGTNWSWRTAVRDITFLALALLLAAGVSVVMLRQSYQIWAATHGHGTRGTWTAQYHSDSARRITWYGDFAPNDGGPTRHNVALVNNLNDLHIGSSIPAAVLGTSSDSDAFATSDAWGGYQQRSLEPSSRHWLAASPGS